MGTPPRLVMTIDGRVVPESTASGLVAALAADGTMTVKALPTPRPPAQVTVRTLLGALAAKAISTVDSQIGDNGFVEAEHPRDRKGRWIEKGGRVRMGLRGLGTVIDWNGTDVRVRRDRDGAVVHIDASKVDNVPTRKPSGARSTAGGRRPRPAPAPAPPRAARARRAAPAANAPQVALTSNPVGEDRAEAAFFDEYWAGFTRTSTTFAALTPEQRTALEARTRARAAQIGVTAALREARDTLNGTDTPPPMANLAPNFQAPGEPNPGAPDAPDTAVADPPDAAADVVPAHVTKKVEAIRKARGITPERAKDWPARAVQYYRGDDEYMVIDDAGHEHYGAHGAAGVLVRHRDAGGVDRYLVQLRSKFVQHGNTWSTPGGAMNAGENPAQAGAREAMEELGADPSQLREVFTNSDDHGGWAYHTVVLDAPEMFGEGDDAEGGWESAGIMWATREELDELPLHPGFKGTYKQITDRAAQTEAGDPVGGVDLPQPMADLAAMGGQDDDGVPAHGLITEDADAALKAAKEALAVQGGFTDEQAANIAQSIDGARDVVADPLADPSEVHLALQEVLNDLDDLDMNVTSGSPEHALIEQHRAVVKGLQDQLPAPDLDDEGPDAPGGGDDHEAAVKEAVQEVISDWQDSILGYDEEIDQIVADLIGWADGEVGFEDTDPIKSLDDLSHAMHMAFAGMEGDPVYQVYEIFEADAATIKETLQTLDNPANGAPSAPGAPGAQGDADTPKAGPPVHVDVQATPTDFTPTEELNLLIPAWTADFGGWGDDTDEAINNLAEFVTGENDSVDVVATLGELQETLESLALSNTDNEAAEVLNSHADEIHKLTGKFKATGFESATANAGPLDDTKVGHLQTHYDDLTEGLGETLNTAELGPLQDPLAKLHEALVPGADPADVHAALDGVDEALVKLVDDDDALADVITDLRSGPVLGMRKLLGAKPATVNVTGPGDNDTAVAAPADAGHPAGIIPASVVVPGPHDPDFSVDMHAAATTKGSILGGGPIDNNYVGATFLNYAGSDLKASAKTPDGMTFKPGDTVSVHDAYNAKVLAIRDMQGFFGDDGTTKTVALLATENGKWSMWQPENLTPAKNGPTADAPGDNVTGTVLDVAAVEAPPGVPQSQSTAVTEAMKIAVKQKWKLPTGTLASLTDALAKVQMDPVPSVLELMDGKGLDAEAAAKEHKRLLRNAKTNEWRARTKLQAAIDTLKAKDGAGKVSGVEAAAAKAGDATAIDVTDTKQLDALVKGPGDPPTSLYTLSGEEFAAGAKAGPGAVGPFDKWYDKLAATKAGDPPIPVNNLVTESGYKVERGFAYKDAAGRAYLVEARTGETTEATLARAAQAQAVVDGVLKSVPEAHRGLIRGIQLVEGANPKDAHWAKEFNLPGFVSDATGGQGGLTVWNGQVPKPTTVAHEFGHSFDPSHGGLAGAGSKSGSWMTVAGDDQISSAAWAGKFKETRLNGHVSPIHLGQKAPTAYGNNSVGEDFAESVRLWLKDRREGKVGYDPTTGNNLRFSDLFPERARRLDALFGVENDYETPARAAARATAENRFYQALKTGTTAPPAISDVMAATGLPRDVTTKAYQTAAERWAKDKAAIDAAKAAAEAEAKKAAEAAAKIKADAEAEAAAAKKFATLKDAIAAGALPKDVGSKLAARVRAAKFHAKKKGKTEAEANEIASAYEAKLIAEALGGAGATTTNTPPKTTASKSTHQVGTVAATTTTAAGVATGEPWKNAKAAPEMAKTLRTKANTWVGKAGKTVHPGAKTQTGAAGQAKANIMAAVAERLDNKADWEIFRKYVAQDRSFDYNEGSAQGGGLSSNPQQLPAWENSTPAQRRDLLARGVNARVGQWASTSGDTSQPAVLMQHAVKEEFGVAGHPAPRMMKYEYDQYLELWPKVGDWYKRVARAMYDHTQAEFAKAGITHVSVFRGMRFSAGGRPTWAAKGKTARPGLQPVNSWSTSLTIANRFGGQDTLLVATFPVEAVLGTAATGFGCLNEKEFVILDVEGQVLVTDSTQFKDA